MKKALILIGPPGSGKGTQAELLAERLGFFHFESSMIVKHWITKHPHHPLFEKSMDNYKKGGLFEPELMAHVVKVETERILKSYKGIIYDGSPRTLAEIHEIWPFWKKTFGTKNIIVLNLKMNLEAAKARLGTRLVCEFDHSYRAGENNLTVGSKCPKDNSPLKVRDLDDPKVIEVRFEEFKKQTEPAIELLRHYVGVLDIDAHASRPDVFNTIVQEITPHFKVLKNGITKR